MQTALHSTPESAIHGDLMSITQCPSLVYLGYITFLLQAQASLLPTYGAEERKQQDQRHLTYTTGLTTANQTLHLLMCTWAAAKVAGVMPAGTSAAAPGAELGKSTAGCTAGAEAAVTGSCTRVCGGAFGGAADTVALDSAKDGAVTQGTSAAGSGTLPGGGWASALSCTLAPGHRHQSAVCSTRQWL